MCNRGNHGKVDGVIGDGYNTWSAGTCATKLDKRKSHQDRLLSTKELLHRQQTLLLCVSWEFRLCHYQKDSFKSGTHYGVKLTPLFRRAEEGWPEDISKCEVDDALLAGPDQGDPKGISSPPHCCLCIAHIFTHIVCVGCAHLCVPGGKEITSKLNNIKPYVEHIARSTWRPQNMTKRRSLKYLSLGWILVHGMNMTCWLYNCNLAN